MSIIFITSPTLVNSILYAVPITQNCGTTSVHQFPLFSPHKCEITNIRFLCGTCTSYVDTDIGIWYNCYRLHYLIFR